MNDIGNGTASDSVTATPAVIVDYDTDNDGLIEIADLAQLNAIRWDLDGNGAVATGDQASYDLASPNAAAGMGCPSGCDGYELTTDLDFDTNGDGTIDANDDYWNDGAGWEPIGTLNLSFSTEFEGNGHTISNLYVMPSSLKAAGLFGALSSTSSIQNLGLVNVNVNCNCDNTGGLVGQTISGSRITASYTTGSVKSTKDGKVAGGLVGNSASRITASYSTAAVTGEGHLPSTGGLVGYTRSGSNIIASYATGRVIPNVLTDSYGGLVGKKQAGQAPTVTGTPRPAATRPAGRARARPPPSCRRPPTTPASTPTGTTSTATARRTPTCCGSSAPTTNTPGCTGNPNPHRADRRAGRRFGDADLGQPQ